MEKKMPSNFEINSNSKKPLPDYLIDGNNLKTFSAILSNFWINFIIHLKQKWRSALRAFSLEDWKSEQSGAYVNIVPV